MLFLQMNERKPTWNCPVCDSKALYENLMIDGYFLDVLQSDKMPKDENEIILERVRLLLLRLGHSKHSNRNEYHLVFLLGVAIILVLLL